MKRVHILACEKITTNSNLKPRMKLNRFVNLRAFTLYDTISITGYRHTDNSMPGGSGGTDSNAECELKNVHSFNTGFSALV